MQENRVGLSASPESASREQRNFSKIVNPKLREYLEHFDKNLPDQDYFSVDDLIHRVNFDLPPPIHNPNFFSYTIYSLQESLRKSGIIPHMRTPRGGSGTRYLILYDREQLYAIAAIMWQTKPAYALGKNGSEIKQLSETLGDDGLNDIIFPKDLAPGHRFNVVQYSFPYKKWATGTDYEAQKRKYEIDRAVSVLTAPLPPRAAPIEVDRPQREAPRPVANRPLVLPNPINQPSLVRPEPKGRPRRVESPYQYILRLSQDDLNEAQGWTREIMEEKFRSIRTRDLLATVSSRDVPPSVLRTLVVVFELNNKSLRNLDEIIDDVNNKSLLQMINLTLTMLKAVPKLENLAELANFIKERSK